MSFPDEESASSQLTLCKLFFSALTSFLLLPKFKGDKLELNRIFFVLVKHHVFAKCSFYRNFSITRLSRGTRNSSKKLLMSFVSLCLT